MASWMPGPYSREINSNSNRRCLRRRNPFEQKLRLPLVWRKSMFFLLGLTLLIAPARGDEPEGEQEVAQFLSQTVEWYRHLPIERDIAVSPSDAVFVDDNARLAPQIVSLAFDFARSQEQLYRQETGTQAPVSQRYQALSNAAQRLDATVQQTQQEVDGLRQKLQTAPTRKRSDLQATLSETEAELQLFQARRDVVRAMLTFVGSTAASGSPTGLAAQIEALSHSVPPSLSSAPVGTAARPEASTTMPPSAANNKPQPTGLWGLISSLISTSRRVGMLDSEVHRTDALADSCKNLKNPLLTQLKEMAQQSDAIAKQADTDPKAVLAQDKNQLDKLTAQFKLLSASFLPLSKESILIDVYAKNLANWQTSLHSQYISEWKNLSIRLASLVIVLAIVFGLSQLWRRAIFHYVHETRRRYQLLLMRRIVVWIIGILVIALAFASELGSVATFAGLITAGVAVALQNVILSVAGYFFLIGKFGVRVGDRVQISGVNGEIVDIGLVRMHVMELAGYGRDLQPTGRVVAFSNSVVFQSGAGIFRQIPGTNFVWHEITLTLAFESDYRSVEQRMIRVIDSAFATYGDHLERQRELIESNLNSVSVGPLRPRTTFKLTSSGLEVKISYPVDVNQATDIDDRVTRAILRELDREPRLKMVGSDIPTIHEMSEAQAGNS